MHVLDVSSGSYGVLLLDVETDQTLTGCPECGGVAIGHARRIQLLHDAPFFSRPVRGRWSKRIWRCPEPACRRRTWTEDHAFAAPRGKLTRRAIGWAVDGLRHDDTTVSALARHLGVAWDTCWAALKPHAESLIKVPARVRGVKTLGVDEHIWRPSKVSSTDKAVTVMVDLTRDGDGCLHARLLDAVQGRSGRVYAEWLSEQGVEVTVTVEHAALDPFRGYMNAIRDELPDATAVLDAFHVVKLAGNALDEVRCRVQQAALHRRGHKDDPLYRIRRTLLTGAEHLTDRQRQRLDRYLPVGDPHGESNSPGPSTRQSAASTTPRRRRVGREQAEKLLESPPHLPHQGDRPARPDASAVASRDPRLLHHRGRLQRRHRGHQRRHREDPTPRARLPQLHQLPHPHPARRRRLTPLPTPATSGPIKP